MKTEHHTLADGRPLAYSEFGDPTGIPVFHAHGGPDSRIEGRIFDKAAQARGYRFIVTDRPGMGESTYLEGRRLLDYPLLGDNFCDAWALLLFAVPVVLLWYSPEPAHEPAFPVCPPLFGLLCDSGRHCRNHARPGRSRDRGICPSRRVPAWTSLSRDRGDCPCLEEHEREGRLHPSPGRSACRVCRILDAPGMNMAYPTGKRYTNHEQTGNKIRP